jgi:hypothetical protein
VHNVSDVRKLDIQKAEQLVPGPSRLEAEIAISKEKKYISPFNYNVPSELIQSRCETLLSAIHN